MRFIRRSVVENGFVQSGDSAARGDEDCPKAIRNFNAETNPIVETI